MMHPLALSMASAASPSGVEEVVWAAPFTLATPHRYSHTVEPRAIDSGWLLELKVDPAHMVPRQVGVPLLWVGDHVAVRTNWDHVGGCAVVWVPGELDPEKASIFFGSALLPERVDLDTRKAELARGAAAGHGPVPVREVSAPISSATFMDLMRVAADRVERCSPADADRIDALRSE